MEFKDYYKIMGLDDSATQKEVKKAYHKLARRYHPDVSKEKDAEQKFKELGEAYEVLGDPEKRKEYDQLKAAGGRRHGEGFTPPPGWESASGFSFGDGEGADFSDFFESMFGGGGGFRRQGGRQQGFRMRGEDVHYELPVFLEQAFKGDEQVIEFTVPQADERGQVTRRQKKLKIKIPAGTAEGQTLRLKGQGAPGIGDAPPGDLLIRIQFVPHPLYSVDGRNISMVAPVAPWEAALGGKITVPTLHGKTRVTIPPNSQAGSRLRLPGKGLPGKPAGDFYVTLKIVMPDKLTEKSKQLFEQLAEEAGAFNPRADWEDKA